MLILIQHAKTTAVLIFSGQVDQQIGKVDPFIFRFFWSAGTKDTKMEAVWWLGGLPEGKGKLVPLGGFWKKTALVPQLPLCHDLLSEVGGHRF